MFKIGILRNGPIVWKSPNYSNWDFLRANTEAQQIQKPIDGAIPAHSQESNVLYDCIGDGLITVPAVGTENGYFATDIDTSSFAYDCRLHSIGLWMRTYEGQVHTYRVRIQFSRASNPYYIAYLAGASHGSPDAAAQTGRTGGSINIPMYDFPVLAGDVIEINYRRWTSASISEVGWQINLKRNN